MLAGYRSPLATRQEISEGEDFLANSVTVTSGGISGEISSAYTAHGIRLRHRRRQELLRLSGVRRGLWNFYKSRSGTETLVAKISGQEYPQSAFAKNGGTASQFTMADGGVASRGDDDRHRSHLGWTSNGGADGAAYHASMNALAFWNPGATGAAELQPAVLRPGTLRRHRDAHAAAGSTSPPWASPATTSRGYGTAPQTASLCCVCRRGGRLHVADTRSVNTNYTQLGDKGVYADFKLNTTVGLPTTAGFSPVLSGVKPWGDSRRGRPRAPAGIPRHRAVYYRLREARRHIRGMAENPHRRQLRRHTRHPLPHGRHRPGGGRRENIPLVNVTARHPATTGGSAKGASWCRTLQEPRR